MLNPDQEGQPEGAGESRRHQLGPHQPRCSLVTQERAPSSTHCSLVGGKATPGHCAGFARNTPFWKTLQHRSKYADPSCL